MEICKILFVSKVKDKYTTKMLVNDPIKKLNDYVINNNLVICLTLIYMLKKEEPFHIVYFQYTKKILPK